MPERTDSPSQHPTRNPATATLIATAHAWAQEASPPTMWHAEADVVVIGSGATGLPAAIVTREAGASVIVVEAEKDIGGHAITSGGNVPLGGGTSARGNTASRTRPTCCSTTSPTGPLLNQTGFPTTVTMTARSCVPSPTTASPPMNGWSRTA